MLRIGDLRLTLFFEPYSYPRVTCQHTADGDLRFTVAPVPDSYLCVVLSICGTAAVQVGDPRFTMASVPYSYLWVVLYLAPLLQQTGDLRLTSSSGPDSYPCVGLSSGGKAGSVP